MLAKAEVRYVRMSARKVRLVLDLIKGKTVEEAGFILDNTAKGACASIKKVLDSAFANANNNRQEKLLAKEVVISGIKADGGPMFKRYRAATMGRAAVIRHRTTHICVELDMAGSTEKTKKRKTKENK
ncbi:MAG: 50S ribosomal protein L22 [Candidatus Omnitrophica bacterium]|nr:50S ribosomal protein L22 [Candidatus Omnitrophota bacterium]MDD5487393.1 50S ribosomal protein L22 [Candidatus Omnitrophota bacterium]